MAHLVIPTDASKLKITFDYEGPFESSFLDKDIAVVLNQKSVFATQMLTVAFEHDSKIKTAHALVGVTKRNPAGTPERKSLKIQAGDKIALSCPPFIDNDGITIII